jgi:hypothetical protein
MDPFCRSFLTGHVVALAALTFSFANLSQAQGEPTIVSVVPANLATGVSPSAPVVFTFSEAMDPDMTDATFLSATTFMMLPTSPVWSAGNTVLTCTPNPPFPANTFIVWDVSGQNPNGDALSGDTSGFFTTGGSGTGTGSGTNHITTFALGKIHAYEQTSVAAPMPETNAPYSFSALTTLASNRTATAVTLTLPNSAVSNLMQVPFRPEEFFLFFTTTNLSSLNNTYPDGNYTFTVQSAASNQMVTVNLPASLMQPNAPRVTNFVAAQSVDASQPFRLGWDNFAGGTANDYISVNIGTAFRTPDPGTAGALNGTATSVLIPAGTFQPNTTYESTIGFSRANVNTNNSAYATTVYRGTTTRFNLITSGGSGGPLVLTNAAWTANMFNFEVVSSVGQTFTVEYSSTMLSGEWQTLLTTNSLTGRLLISDPHSTTNSYLFYRARNGP